MGLIETLEKISDTLEEIFITNGPAHYGAKKKLIAFGEDNPAIGVRVSNDRPYGDQPVNHYDSDNKAIHFYWEGDGCLLKIDYSIVEKNSDSKESYTANANNLTAMLVETLPSMYKLWSLIVDKGPESDETIKQIINLVPETTSLYFLDIQTSRENTLNPDMFSQMDLSHLSVTNGISITEKKGNSFTNVSSEEVFNVPGYKGPKLKSRWVY